MITKVVGSPGVGKTTYLVDQVKKSFYKYDPNEIGVISFTKNAVEEIKGRIINVTGLNMPYVKTIHSMCYKLLKLRPDDVADSAKNLKNFNVKSEINFSNSRDNANSLGDDTKAKLGLLGKIGLLRNKMIPIKYWNDHILKDEYIRWRDFCVGNCLVDYTGMLELVLERGLIPPIKVLFIDEAQDLTALQVAVISMWSKRCENTIFCGDANQSIFKFAGASPEIFIKLKYDNLIVLPKSYRLPSRILSYSTSMLSRSTDNDIVNYKPLREGGEIESDALFESCLDGENMMLGRCNYDVTKWIKVLQEKGVMYHNPYRNEPQWNPLSSPVIQALKVYFNKEDTRRSFTIEDIQNIAKYTRASVCFQYRGSKSLLMNINHNVKGGDISKSYKDESLYDICQLQKVMHNYDFKDEFIDQKIPIEEAFRMPEAHEWIINIIKNDVNILYEKPKCIVGTVHSIKGGETDHVWIDTSLPRVVTRNMDNQEVINNEVHIAYVAVTRARKTVNIINSNRHNTLYSI